MSRRITQKELQALFPPTPEDYARRASLAARRERNSQEEIPMKKKLSLGMILVIALLIAALATAIALSIPREYFENVAKMEFSSGFYEDWSLKEKIQLLDLMKQYEVPYDKEKAAFVLNESKPAAEREKLLDEMMSERYGVNGRIDVITLESILIREMGDPVTWSLEDKAWYTQMHKDNGILGYDVMINQLPEKGDTQPDAAITIAKAAIAEAFEAPIESLDGYDTYIDFAIHLSMADKYDPYYYVMLSTKTPPEGLPTYLTCCVSRDGRVLDSSEEATFHDESPAEYVGRYKEEYARKQRDESVLATLIAEKGADIHRWSLEDKAKAGAAFSTSVMPPRAVSPYWTMPTAEEITPDAALTAAKRAISEKHGVDETTLNGLQVTYEHFACPLYENGTWARRLEDGGLILDMSISESCKDVPPPFYVLRFYKAFEQGSVLQYAVTLGGVAGDIHQIELGPEMGE